jgi:hypothetical protein
MCGGAEDADPAVGVLDDGEDVTPIDQVAVPAQDGVRSHQQPPSAQHPAGQGPEKGGEQGPVLGRERHPVSAELPLQDGDLMPQRQNLHVLVQSPTGSSRSAPNAFVTAR